MSKSECLILLGPPNSGKTTLFNWITGYKRQIINYPGSTADLALGQVSSAHLASSDGKTKKQKPNWTVIDTPGFYGFFTPSPELEVTKKALKEALKNKELRAVILVLDSTRLKRQLPLFFQLKSAGLPVILALTMYDVQKKESHLDINLLSRILKVPVCPIEGLLGGGVKELLATAESACPQSGEHDDTPWSESKQATYLKKADAIVHKVLVQKDQTTIGQKTKIWDSFLLHPVFGFAFLSLILFAFFSSIFWLAQPLMDLVDRGVGYGVATLLSKGGPGGVMDFLANGVLTGFGSFLIFIPQIFILFLGLCLLEDSGYMARAVSLVDGPFSRIGLSGKSLFPFLSGFACAIPAILSARSISSRKERLITIFVLPFMTCSARLPVYALLLGFLFYGDSAWKPGLLMAFLYFLSLFLGMGVAGLLSLFVSKDKKSSFFMELPLYRRPVLKSVLAVSWSRTKHFILKAGPVIFMFSLLMWAVTNYPRGATEASSIVNPPGPPYQGGTQSGTLDGATEVSSIVNPPGPPYQGGTQKETLDGAPAVDRDTSQKDMAQSYAGQFGRWIEPVFEKMGGDWRIGVSLLSAFVAREVFVSVLAVTLKNTTSNPAKTTLDREDESIEEGGSFQRSGLVKVMKQAQWRDEGPLFSTGSILALLVFFIFSLQCLSTTAVVYKEMGSWKWAMAQLVSFNLLAYILAVLTYSLIA